MNFQKMMQQAQKMQQQMNDMQARLELEEFEGKAGGGLVKIILSGKSEMKKISIDDSLLKPDEKEVLEDLIIAAHNDAKSTAEANFTEQMAKIGASMGLPPGMKLPF